MNHTCSHLSDQLQGELVQSRAIASESKFLDYDKIAVV